MKDDQERTSHDDILRAVTRVERVVEGLAVDVKSNAREINALKVNQATSHGAVEAVKTLIPWVFAATAGLWAFFKEKI